MIPSSIDILFQTRVCELATYALRFDQFFALTSFYALTSFSL